MTKVRNFDWNWLLVAGLSLLAIGPFLAPGYFWGAHDARHNVYFLFLFDRVFQDGVWWPRWLPDFTFGYGYPFFNIYGPLASFVGEAFHLLGGLDFVAAVEAVFIVSIVASGLGMYGFARAWGGRGAGLVAAVAYVYLPYHLFDLYVRMALAESVALAFIPFVFWGCRALVTRPRWAAVFGTALAYAGLMLTSHLVTFIITPPLILYVAILGLVRLNREQPLRQVSAQSVLPLLANLTRQGFLPGLALALGLGLSAIFWLPALTEFRYVRQDQWYGGRYDYRDDFIYFHQLFSPAWGFGISGPGPDDPVGFGLGVVPVILALVGLGLARRGREAEGARWDLRFSWGLLLLGAFLTLGASAPLWEWLSPIRFAQFPWRYLTYTTVALASLSAAAMAGRHQATLPALFLSALLILGSYPYLRGEVREPAEGPVSLAGMMRFMQSADEMTGATAWVTERPHWSPMADVIIAGGEITSRVDYSRESDKSLIVGSVGLSAVHEELYFRAEGPGKRIVFNHFYYPGWRAYLLDKEQGRPVRELTVEVQEPLGRMTVEVPAGEGWMILRFEDTPVRVAGKAASGLTLVLLVLGWVIRWVGRRR
ncbi:MAG: hypothetical protein IT330_14485 [Anaerolineae bacterium]|nr:hypothetical protein [Anaerolineae bacterium]